MRRRLLAAAIAVGTASMAAACEPHPAAPTAAEPPQPPLRLAEGLPERQRQIFERTCAHCHLRPGIGVPQLGDAEAWRARARDGEEALLRRTVLGSGAMPPLGTCGFCSEDDLRLLVAFLAGLPADGARPEGRVPRGPGAAPQERVPRGPGAAPQERVPRGPGAGPQ